MYDTNYTEVFGAPQHCMLLERNSAFCFANEAFTDYLHGIQQQGYDTVDAATISNFDLLGDAETGIRKRGKRISIVLWSK